MVTGASVRAARRSSRRSPIATATSTASRSLNEPEVATCSPASRPLEDQDLVAQHRAALHRPHVRAGLAGPVGGDHEHVVAARALAQRAHRNGDRLAGRPDRDLHPHRGAGRRRACRPTIRARTVALRVVGSTRASIATIRARTGGLSSPAVTLHLSPTRRPPATRWATVKSTCDRVVHALERGELGALVRGTGRGARRRCRPGRGTAPGSSSAR